MAAIGDRGSRLVMANKRHISKSFPKNTSRLFTFYEAVKNGFYELGLYSEKHATLVVSNFYS
jgi:hypothetical protein